MFVNSKVIIEPKYRLLHPSLDISDMRELGHVASIAMVTIQWG